MEGAFLPRLLDYAIATHFPSIWNHTAESVGRSAEHPAVVASSDPGAGDETRDNGAPASSKPTLASALAELKRPMYMDFLRAVSSKTARLCAMWMSLGFTHGVLNTDNMSVTGLTLDYGPFGFMERYDPGYTPNASDDSSRYSFEAQPERCRYNIQKLSEALQPVRATRRRRRRRRRRQQNRRRKIYAR